MKKQQNNRHFGWPIHPPFQAIDGDPVSFAAQEYFCSWEIPKTPGMIDRKCFSCGKQIQFHHFKTNFISQKHPKIAWHEPIFILDLDAMYPHVGGGNDELVKEAKEMWNDPIFEILCCACLKKWNEKS